MVALMGLLAWLLWLLFALPRLLMLVLLPALILAGNKLLSLSTRSMTRLFDSLLLLLLVFEGLFRLVLLLFLRVDLAKEAVLGGFRRVEVIVVE